MPPNASNGRNDLIPRCGHLLRDLGLCPCGPAVPDDPEPDVAAADLVALEASIYRDSLADFFRAGWHVLEASTPLVDGPHIDVICGAVQAVLEDWARRQKDPTFVQRARDVLITVPPGTAKSRIVAVYATAWAWLRWPHLRMICLSANPRVALRDADLAREVIRSDWYQSTFAPSWQIRDDADAKGRFVNTAGGFRSAMGMDARIVGERGDALIVDDPHDPEEALSDAQRGAVNDRWEASIANRVNDLGSSVRIGICQRVHEDDWSAHRIAEGWTHLDLPMLFEPERACSTPIGSDWRTVEGECLHPARFPPDVIAREQSPERGGAVRWATLYQGRPAPAGGAMVKAEWLRFYRAPGSPETACPRPRGCWTGPAVTLPARFDGVVLAADFAAGKLTKAGDYNVILALGKRGADFFVLDVWRARADYLDAVAKFRDFAKRWPAARKAVESAGLGISLVSSLQRDVPGLIGVPARDGKKERMNAVLQFYEAGNVHFLDGATYLDDVIAELITFPNARHDDFPDALNLALSQAVGGDETALEEEREKAVRLLAMCWDGAGAMPLAVLEARLPERFRPARPTDLPNAPDHPDRGAARGAAGGAPSRPVLEVLGGGDLGAGPLTAEGVIAGLMPRR